MPAKSKAQRRMMGMEYAKSKKGEKSETGMSKAELKKMASGSEKDMPMRMKKSKKK